MSMLSVQSNNRFSRLVDEIFESAHMQRSAFNPACEIHESGNFYQINFEIPGVESKDVDISVVDKNLIVSGVKHKIKVEGSETSVFNERNYGEFKRTFSMPEDADPEKITAKYKSGILTLKLQKVKPAKPKQIKIEVREE